MSLRNSFTPYNSNVATMVFIGTSFDCTAILNAVAMVVKKLAAAAPDMLKSYLKKMSFGFVQSKYSLFTLHSIWIIALHLVAYVVYKAQNMT